MFYFIRIYLAIGGVWAVNWLLRLAMGKDKVIDDIEEDEKEISDLYNNSALGRLYYILVVGALTVFTIGLWPYYLFLLVKKGIKK